MALTATAVCHISAGCLQQQHSEPPLKALSKQEQTSKHCLLLQGLHRTHTLGWTFRR